MIVGAPARGRRRAGVRVHGTVQGVGFRPYVYRLAHELELGGFVLNDAEEARRCELWRLQGVATKEGIDAAMKGGCGFPMGPFALLDLVGLDTSLAILDALYEEFRDPNYSAVPLLRRLVTSGQLGRKTKKGFYDYNR